METALTHVPPVPIQLNDESTELSKQTHIQDVHIGEATIVKGTNGSKFTSYSLVITLSSGVNIKIMKRYSEFEALAKQLMKIYPNRLIEIPKLPPKNYLGNNFSNEFLNKRRRGLEFFTNAVLLNPVFNTSNVVKNFITE
ncbi:hypothetical protein WICMUC_004232 [Wickerhamomyces mucosus]|uniref:Endosomal/vacuolar adapter protein YPT35 n=1 Tax=Wickerhamomyces mucosus TaxID=1378264 RepID=A0A9P8TBP5_9ASCO|nr:hypothetical protein WICMUC_004232 [Wickerhamomyces mucosus]